MPFIKAAEGLRNKRAPKPELAVSLNLFRYVYVCTSAAASPQEGAASQHRTRSRALNGENKSFAVFGMMGL